MPSKKKAIGVRVPDEIYDKIESIAKSRRWSMSATVEWLIEQTFKGSKSKGVSDDNEGSNGK